MIGNVNMIAVLVAAVAAMVVGGIWYSPQVFGGSWRKTFKQNKSRAKKEMPLVVLIMFVAMVLTAYVLAHFGYVANKYFGNTILQDTMTTAIMLWAGLAIPAILLGLLEQRRKLGMLIHIAGALIVIEVMALIIGTLRP